jgi:heme-degrading monooxygenase HmoA
MIAVIFEVEPRDGRARDYFDIAAGLRPELEKIDGFISVERFESTSTPGRFVSLSFWRDEAAVSAWRELGEHKSAQERGKAEIFAGYRIRVAEVLRDYDFRAPD